MQTISGKNMKHVLFKILMNKEDFLKISAKKSTINKNTIEGTVCFNNFLEECSSDIYFRPLLHNAIHARFQDYVDSNVLM